MSNDFMTKALEMAERMTTYNVYEENGQAGAEARATDIRKIVEILTGATQQQRNPAGSVGTLDGYEP